MARCSEMLALAGTVLQFSRLDRVEVGGTKGKNISAAIKTVHADFTAAHERFQQARA
jgi:dynein heavy chain, axonemal